MEVKQIVVILITFLGFLSCKAQIVPLFGDYDMYTPNSGVYYKDVDNDFNHYVGTWLWQEGNNSLKLIFKKAIQIDDGDGYTYDVLYGEYQYIENGIEKVNTLADLNNPNIDPLLHKINNPLIMTNNYLPQCHDCEEDERRVSIGIDHPDYYTVRGKLIMRYKIESGVEKIYALLITDRYLYKLSEDEPYKIDVPFCEYVFIKQ